MLDLTSRVPHRLGTATLLALVLTATSTAQPPQWVQTNTTPWPYARAAHAMAYDSLRGRTVVFGGASGAGARGDTWEFNGSNWTIRSTAGPSSRYGHAMVYDSQRGRVVLFGGYTPGNPGGHGDTWEWDGISWALAASVGPAGRSNHAMAYDSQRARTVLFGGDPLDGATWEWNGSTWTQRGAAGPPPRRNHAMSYDSQRGCTVLFGGQDGQSNYRQDTWEWDGNVWTLRANSGPTARDFSAMVYDSQRGFSVLFGGRTVLGVQGDIWEWNGSSWFARLDTGPPPRYLHPMVFDSQRRRIVLFGGAGLYGTYLADTWERASFASATSFGTGCGSPPLTLSPVASAGPILNTTARVALANVPSPLAFVAIGWSSTYFGWFQLPIQFAGMPGCALLQSADFPAVPVVPTGPGSARYDLAVPNQGSLLGLSLHLQGWANAPGANAADLIVSNGVTWIVGNQ